MRLVVRQVYNNNSVLVDAGADREAIVQGKGVGFGKRKGDELPVNSASKIIYLDDSRVRGQFTNLLKNVPIDIVVAVFGSVDAAKSKYQLQLLDYIYVTLTDHVFQMYKRLTENRYKPSAVPDIHDQYPLEYAAAEDTLTEINQTLHVRFPNAEINSLALHFINAQGDEEDNDTSGKKDTDAQVNKAVMEVFDKFHIVRNAVNQNYFDRLMIHLQYMVERVEDNSQDNQMFTSDMYQEYQRKFPQSYVIASEISTALEDRLHVKLTQNERFYFIIHIQRLIQEQNKQ